MDRTEEDHSSFVTNILFILRYSYILLLLIMRIKGNFDVYLLV